MRAGEHHPQFVVADGIHVDAIGARSDVVHHGREFLSRADGFASQPIKGAVAGNRHDPSAGVVGHAVARPGA